MRRIFAILVAAGLIGSSIACCHTAGVCDCDFGGYPCSACLQPYPGMAPTSPPPLTTGEQLKAAPTPVDNLQK
jgi:hypothetical protein